MSRSLRDAVVDVAADIGSILAAWLLLFGLEHLAVAVLRSEQFAGTWELTRARRLLTPIAIACSIPASAAVVALGYAAAARRWRAIAAVAAVVAAACAWGLSTGRHFEDWRVRGLFVAAAAAVSAFVAGGVARLLMRHRTHANRIGLAGAAVAVATWFVNASVFTRLYPVMHWALAAGTMIAWSAVVLFFRPEPQLVMPGLGRRVYRVVGCAMASLAMVAACTMHICARALEREDNVRRVYTEHAPILGHAVRFASVVAPTPATEDDPSSLATSDSDSSASTEARPDDSRAAAGSSDESHSRARRRLDWTGRDLVVITIDALRADHVSAYGYARPTTPNIDALAARGVRFERAYCPTPHTSYSIASLMTGTYMRPLLAMGGTDEAETWATHLRRYGYRTAAFYPPAVFFIDGHRFAHMKQSGLGFEYRKEEFASPQLRSAQVAQYISEAPTDRPLFLWVHLFEPHEPYIKHPDHDFGGDLPSDLYDSEVAAADGVVGAIVAAVHKRNDNAVFIVSADHGEEFGDHGGRYHGTTAYEEQVRVPLVIAGPKIAPGVRRAPVQTIDLLPTVLAALDIPRPARVRGRDLGEVIAENKPTGDHDGLAFAESDDYTMVARGSDRLVCLRKIASCTLFDISVDPQQKSPVSDRPARVRELRKLTANLEREHGKLEAAGIPDALRRGLQGERDAAEEVATLFDDARVEIRRDAARCAFRLRAPEMLVHIKRSYARDEDEQVRLWSALTLLRLGNRLAATGTSGDAGRGGPSADGLERWISAALAKPRDSAATHANPRLAAALALAEQGDRRGETELLDRWSVGFAPQLGRQDGTRPNDVAAQTRAGDLDEAKDLLAALGAIRSTAAVPMLLRSLDDVRLRPWIVDALATIGDPHALTPLIDAFCTERYVDARAVEARAIASLWPKANPSPRDRDRMARALVRFAGVPEPMPEAITTAAELGLLTPSRGGWRGRVSAHDVIADDAASSSRTEHRPQRAAIRRDTTGGITIDVDLEPARIGAEQRSTSGGSTGATPARVFVVGPFDDEHPPRLYVRSQATMNVAERNHLAVVEPSASESQAVALPMTRIGNARAPAKGTIWIADVPDRHGPNLSISISLHVAHDEVVRGDNSGQSPQPSEPSRALASGTSPVGVWLVPRADELPPPPPQAWHPHDQDGGL